MNEDLLAGALTALLERHQVPGAVLVLDVAGNRYSVAAGYRRAGGTARMTTDAVFAVGSITKVMVAHAALLLADSGDLELDRPLPEVPGTTARDLLGHSSGLPRDFEPGSSLTDASLARLARACQGVATVLNPGTGFSYSNLGYALLGHMVQQAIGVPWQEAVALLVLQPLGIEPAFCADPAGSYAVPWTRPSVSGHLRGVGGRLIGVDPSCPAYLGPAGGAGGTAADVAAIGRAQLPGSAGPFPERVLKVLHEEIPFDVPVGLAHGWTLGLARYRSRSGVWLGHDGTTIGGTAHLRIDPRSETVVALLTNAAWGAELWRDVVTLLSGHGIDVGDYRPPTVTPLPVERLPICAGNYVNGSLVYELRLDARRGYVLRAGVGPASPLAIGADLIFCETSPGLDHPGLAGRLRTTTGRVEAIEVNGSVARTGEASPAPGAPGRREAGRAR